MNIIQNNNYLIFSSNELGIKRTSSWEWETQLTVGEMGVRNVNETGPPNTHSRQVRATDENGNPLGWLNDKKIRIAGVRMGDNNTYQMSPPLRNIVSNIIGEELDPKDNEDVLQFLVGTVPQNLHQSNTYIAIEKKFLKDLYDTNFSLTGLTNLADGKEVIFIRNNLAEIQGLINNNQNNGNDNDNQGNKNQLQQLLNEKGVNDINEYNNLLPALILSTDYENYYAKYYEVYNSVEKSNDLTRQIERKINEEIREIKNLSPHYSEPKNIETINFNQTQLQRRIEIVVLIKNYLQRDQQQTNQAENQEEINVQEARPEKLEKTKAKSIIEEKPNKTEELVVEDESVKPVDSADKEQTEENIPEPTDKTSESQTVSGSSPVQESVDSSEETQAKEKQTKEQEELEATINLINQQELSEAKKSAIKIIQKILEENKINFADLAIEKTKGQDWQNHLNGFATSQAVAQFVRQVQATIPNQTQINQTENNKSTPKPNYGLITGIILGSISLSLTVYLVLRQVRRDKK